jgi:meso-butanediol dehydrogenase / (S,S)-butanediol dehydrogenase / diacetyl reductase
MAAGGVTAEFSDRVVLVTGAASGIGLATAAAFAAEGAIVALADVNAEKLEAETARLAAAHDHEIRGYPADLASAQAAEQLAAAVLADHGRVDVLVNNAGIAFMGTVLETSVAQWDHVFATNVRAAFCVSKAVLPAMISQGGGVIVNTASEAGLVGFLGYAAYAASKAALVNLTRCMALDHAGHSIRVNCVCPGSIETPLLRDYYAATPDPDGARAEDIKTHPLGIGNPEHIAAGILYLASDRADYVTGHALVIDGGYTAQ